MLGTRPGDALGCAPLLILGEHVGRLVLARARTWPGEGGSPPHTAASCSAKAEDPLPGERD